MYFFRTGDILSSRTGNIWWMFEMLVCVLNEVCFAFVCFSWLILDMFMFLLTGARHAYILAGVQHLMFDFVDGISMRCMSCWRLFDIVVFVVDGVPAFVWFLWRCLNCSCLKRMFGNLMFSLFVVVWHCCVFMFACCLMETIFVYACCWWIIDMRMFLLLTFWLQLCIKQNLSVVHLLVKMLFRVQTRHNHMSRQAKTEQGKCQVRSGQVKTYRIWGRQLYVGSKKGRYVETSQDRTRQMPGQVRAGQDT
jgi:hypothetical protein